MTLHLFQRGHQLDYKYSDKVYRRYTDMSGAIFHIYKFEKVIMSDGTQVEVSNNTISNPVLNENAGRIYSKVAYDLYGFTQMNTPKFSFTFTGIDTLNTDEKEISFHYNSMVEQLGRKIIVGDVIEWSWLRDLDVLGNDKRGFNKWYVVTESARDEKGWSNNYTYHFWKIKCMPLALSTEFLDLINNGDGERPGAGDGINGGEGMYQGSGKGVPGQTNGDIVGGSDDDNRDPGNSQEDAAIEIMDKLLDMAEEQVSFKEYDEHHVYIDEDTIKALPFVLQGDGIPDNMNAVDIPYGEYFPVEAQKGDFYLRIDYNPPRLFQREESSWKLVEYDHRKRWTGTPEELRNLINQNNSYVDELGQTIKMRQNIKDLVKARVKKEHDRPLPWKTIGVTKP